MTLGTLGTRFLRQIPNVALNLYKYPSNCNHYNQIECCSFSFELQNFKQSGSTLINLIMNVQRPANIKSGVINYKRARIISFLILRTSFLDKKK